VSTWGVPGAHPPGGGLAAREAEEPTSSSGQRDRINERGLYIRR